MRGQTNIDFLVGASVFLLTVAFVFATLPNAFAPFTGGESADTLTADRVAAHLAEDELAREGRPAVLNGTCVDQFFDEAAAGPCRPSDLNDALGVGEERRVNVTLESAGGTAKRVGPSVPTNGNVVTAERLVRLDGIECRLQVRVW